MTNSNFVKSENFNAKDAENAKVRRDNLLYFKNIASAVSALKITFCDFITNNK